MAHQIYEVQDIILSTACVQSPPVTMFYDNSPPNLHTWNTDWTNLTHHILVEVQDILMSIAYVEFSNVTLIRDDSAMNLSHIQSASFWPARYLILYDWLSLKDISFWLKTIFCNQLENWKIRQLVWIMSNPLQFNRSSAIFLVLGFVESSFEQQNLFWKKKISHKHRRN